MELLNLIDKYIRSSLKQNNISNNSTIIPYYKEAIISELEANLCKLHDSIKIILNATEKSTLMSHKKELETKITSTQEKIEETSNKKDKFELTYFLDFYQYFLREIEHNLISTKAI